MTIAVLTFKEALRQKLVLLTVLLSAAFLILYTLGVRAAGRFLHDLAGRDPLLASITQTQLLVMGLFFGYLIIALMTVFAGTGTVSSEIESGVLQTIITRPLSRAAVIAGKFLGLGGLLVLYACLFFGTVVGIVHYYTGLGVAGPLPALGFFCLIPVVLLAVTVLGSTVLPTLANGIAVFALYVVGFIGGTVEQLGALIDNAVMVRIGIVSGLLMPADALYRKMVAVLTAATADPLAAVRQMGPLGSLSEPSLWMLVYTLLYACAALALAVRVFNRRDL
ncbi:MAG: ABC transporter permease subunit [Desulfotomaculales bacterium]